MIIDGPQDLSKSHQGPLGICSFDTTEKQLPRLGTVPQHARSRFHGFFVEPWNSFIHISARDAKVVESQSEELNERLE